MGERETKGQKRYQFFPVLTEGQSNFPGSSLGIGQAYAKGYIFVHALTTWGCELSWPLLSFAAAIYGEMLMKWAL